MLFWVDKFLITLEVYVVVDDSSSGVSITKWVYVNRGQKIGVWGVLRHGGDLVHNLINLNY